MRISVVGNAFLNCWLCVGGCYSRKQWRVLAFSPRRASLA